MTPAEPKIPWSTTTRFVSQLSHDLRNHLNAIELQSAFLGEIVEDGEAKKEVERLREMTRDLCADLQKVSRLLAKVQPIPISYRASEFVEDLRAKLEEKRPAEAQTVKWQNSLGEEMLEIDPQLMEVAFLELFDNAFAHDPAEGKISFSAGASGDAIEFHLREPKQGFEHSTQHWGEEPLVSIRHGHYGLGLFRARRILEAHHGTMRAEFDPKTAVFTTTVCLPRLVS
jgi:K+-sensing histidine kinase KdpD